MATLVFVTLVGCENTVDLDEKSNIEPTNTTIAQSTDENNIINEKIEDISVAAKNSSHQSNEEESPKNSVEKEKDSQANQTNEGLKKHYIQKISNTKKLVAELEATDSSTYALKDLENERWTYWDQLLNEIYSSLEKQLSQEEMDRLREEQRNWIKSRDESALASSQKYKGGTQEQLEYVAVLANLTEERCNELVNNYVK